MNKFIESHLKKVQPLSKNVSLTHWDAAITGKPEHYEKLGDLQVKLELIYSDPDDFAYLKQLKDSSEITDPVTKRQIDRLYYAYLANQIEPETIKKMVKLSTDIGERFSTHRPVLDGEKTTDNAIKDILKTEKDSEKRKQAWLASKVVSTVVVDDLLELVKLRNGAARKLGFENFRDMSLISAEQSPQELDEIYSELYELSNEPYKKIKGELDTILAENCGVAVSELMPWHYHDPFFQEPPLVYDLNLDVYYKDKNIEQLAADFFNGIDLNVDSVLKRSDLYEQPGKMPHAFCQDMDRQGDIRILCNIQQNARWMEITLHELGHAVYSKYHDQSVPWLLRTHAHIFTTEAIAMFFGRLGTNPLWMQEMLGLSDKQRSEIAKVSFKYSQMAQIAFLRWNMVMYYFEKALYANPDQDLNSLWWDLVEKYQLVNRPPQRNEPDWAAKIHFTIAPCYYHNYMLGELFASQLNNHIVTKVLDLPAGSEVSYVNSKQTGNYLKTNVFEPANIYNWNEMIRRATGEELNPKYFINDFVR